MGMHGDGIRGPILDAFGENGEMWADTISGC